MKKITITVREDCKVNISLPKDCQVEITKQPEGNERLLTEEEEIAAYMAILKERGYMWDQNEKMVKRWKPKVGEVYWTIDSAGDVYQMRFEDDHVDKERLEFGNFFPTKEKAEEAAKAIKELLMKLKRQI